MNPRRRQSATIASMLLVEFEVASVIAARFADVTGKRGQYANRSRATTTRPALRGRGRRSRHARHGSKPRLQSDVEGARLLARAVLLGGVGAGHLDGVDQRCRYLVLARRETPAAR